MTTLMIGGGLIGAHIAKECLSRKEKVVVLGSHLDRTYLREISGIPDELAIELSISKPGDLIEVLASYNIQKIVVAAGSLHSAFSKETGRAIVNESQLMMAIYTAVHSHLPEKLIYISSLGVYGASQMRMEEQLPMPLSAYGITKLYNEQIVQAIAFQVNIPALIIRPSGVIGPNPNRSGNWMSSELNRVFQAKKEPIAISGKLSSPCEYLDVRDLASFVVDCLAEDGVRTVKECDIVNIGAGKIIVGEELLRRIYEVLKKDLFFLPEDKETIRRKDAAPLPIAKAIERYGYMPKADLAQSLAYIGEFYGH